MTLRRVQIGSFIAMTLVAIGTLASGVSALTGGPTTIAPLIEAVKASVVNISATRPSETATPEFWSRWGRQTQRERRAIGSGVIIDAENGYIITNEHVIRNSVGIVVTLDDGRAVDATVVGDDPASDVAVLQITADNLKALALADSDKTRVGDFVVAIGNPFQLQQTVTSGIVSGLGRKGLGIEEIEDFIQTDASINQGNSGGPLINFFGEVIGINTAIVGGSSGGSVGIGFAIPSNLVKDVVHQLIEFGGITRGFLGIVMSELDPSEAGKYAEMYNLEEVVGVKVTHVMEGTAAFEAGIEKYDFITSFDGEIVSGIGELSNQIKLAKIGDKVPIEILRDGESLTVYAEVRPRTHSGDRLDTVLRGSIVGNINPQDQYFTELDGSGIVIRSIEPDSPAANLGLEVGDVILDISPSDDSDIKQKAIEIFRDGETLTIPAP